MERRKFTKEFKLEAVKLIRDRGVGVTQASRDLGVHQTVLRSWLRAYGDDPVQAFPGHGRQSPEAAEITRLKREGEAQGGTRYPKKSRGLPTLHALNYRVG